uniref:UNC93-like protein MFSD11 n=1 Tax=Globodera rostochiensis TaxID=31243 RepID=A0A914HZB8_GLORO
MSFRLLPCHWWKGLHRNTRNVLQLGIGFFFIFLAFNSQGFIEESVLDSFSPETVPKHAGYTSLCIIYASFTVLNFVAPPIIKCIGTRTSLVLAGCTYVFFLTGFLFINSFFLYFSSALLGLGAAVIWTAQGKYLTLNSSEQTAGKHSSLFLALTQACLSCGGLFLLAVFRATDSSPPSSSETPLVNSSSSDFSPSFDRPTIKLIYGSFTGIALLGVAVLAFLPPSRTKAKMKMGGEEHRKNAIDQEEGALDQIKSIFKLAASRKMVALAFVFGYTGILLSFWSSIFPTALINTLQLRSQFSPKILIALNAIFKGIGQPLLSALFGWFRLDRVKRSRLVFVGMLLHLVAFALTFLILPNETPLGQTNETAVIRPSVVIALFCGFLLSFGDAFWTTQIFSFLITNYSNRSAESFALFKFYQSLLTCFLFYLSGHLLLHWHLLILFSSAIIGYLAFVVAEKLEEKERKAFGATGHN